MQLGRWWLSCCWVSTVGVGISPPRGRWVLLPPPVKLPRPLLQLLPEAVEADLLPGLAGGQSASIIASSCSNPGLSRLHACLDGGDGVSLTPPRPRSWCWMFSISIPSPGSILCGSLAAGLCCGLTRDELMVQFYWEVRASVTYTTFIISIFGENNTQISQNDQYSRCYAALKSQSGLSVKVILLVIAAQTVLNLAKLHEFFPVSKTRPVDIKMSMKALWLYDKKPFFFSQRPNWGV